MIEIVPAIDLMDGGCVRLTEGDFARRTDYGCSPLEMARKYAECGVRRVHIVDLDGARAGFPKNLAVLRSIASQVDIDIEWGGGISSREALGQVLEAGCGHAVIGSVAARQPETFLSWLKEFGPQHITLGADVRGGFVAVKGWTEDSPVTIDELMERFVPEGLTEVICTDISRDGMLQGPACGLYEGLQEEYPGCAVTVSGGVSSMEDIATLDALGLRRVIVGKAIYEGRITLQDIEEWSRKE